ncbi:MAG: Type 1 glutamine amidotransferase-like domain-containing protein [Bacteroidales bacterium]
MKNGIIKSGCSAFLFLFISAGLEGQSYSSYFTGNRKDTVSYPSGGICMMGGATENDQAMRWFLDRCDHGDVLVLRASGSDGYNNYLFSELGVQINSVESVVFKDKSASGEEYIRQKIRQAEGIWLAGGDQWKYVSYWRGTGIDSLINQAVHERKVVVGGTSAGMAILGEYYFSARFGTVSSGEALANPYDNAVYVESDKFLDVPYLNNVITDTHYNNPDRRGRQVVFLARLLVDQGRKVKAVSCNEYTALCIDNDGIARCYGSPEYTDCASFFIQMNCEKTENWPETCSPGIPLEWNKEQAALRVCKIPGTNTGENFFDLKDWKSESGGAWESWYVMNGSLISNPAISPECNETLIQSADMDLLRVCPNPVNSGIVRFKNESPGVLQISLLDISGKALKNYIAAGVGNGSFDCSDLAAGMYLLVGRSASGYFPCKVFIR